jgi:lambda repressor-like predicted transcriptional regulator
MSEKQVNHFRARVEILLRDRGWSMRELARQMNKSQQRTRDIIQRGDPKTSVLKEFADALDVAPEDLLEEVSTEEYGEAFMPTFTG